MILSLYVTYSFNSLSQKAVDTNVYFLYEKQNKTVNNKYTSWHLALVYVILVVQMILLLSKLLFLYQ